MKSAQSFELLARKQGTECLLNDSVEQIETQSTSFGGVVRGPRAYRVTWTFADGGWKHECSCPRGGGCKHAYAVAQHVLQHSRGTESPGEADGEPQTHSLETQIDRLVRLVSGGNTATARKVPHAPPPPRQSVVSKILAAHNPWDALPLLPALLSQLGVREAPESSSFSFLKNTHPEKRAWLLARDLLKLSGRLPPELEAFRTHEKFEREELANQEEDLVTRLQDWAITATTNPGRPTRSMKVLWAWNPAVSLGGPQIRFLLTSKKLKEVPRSFRQIRNFASEALREGQLFSHSDTTFLRWIDSHAQALVQDATAAENTAEHLIPHGSGLLMWLTAWGQTDRCTWEDGTPVRYEDNAAHLVPQVFAPGSLPRPEGRKARSNVDHPVLGFMLDIPGLGRFPMHEVRLVLSHDNDETRSEPIFACVNGTFYRVLGAPPSNVLRGLIASGGVALNSKRRSALLPPLLQRFPRLAENSCGLVRNVPVHLSFTLSLDANDWLSIRLHASSREGPQRWEYTDCGWVRQQEAAPVSAENQTIPSAQPAATTPPVEAATTTAAPAPSSQPGEAVPDASQIEPSQLWLESLGVQSAEEAGFEDQTGWWTPLSSNRMDGFIEQWASRPADVVYWANPAFRSLVSPSHHTTPRVQIRSSGMDWFSISSEWASLAGQLTSADIEKLRTSSETFVKLASGQWIERQQAKKIQEVMEVCAELGIDPNSKEPQQLTSWQLAGIGEAALGKLSTLLEHDAESTLAIETLRTKVAEFKGLPDVPLPKRLRADMRAYQVEGLKFLAYTASLKLGAILADDMGLGKTLQALAWMEHLREVEGPAPCLVVCPASVVYNWQREAEKFVPGSTILLLTSGEARHALRKEIPGHDLIITNYALLRRDLEELRSFDFRAIVLDEAQYIKTPDSQVARAAKQLRASHRLALTGTPLENRLLDLWSISDFAAPGYLGSRTHFTETYDLPDQPHRRRLLTARLRPLLLRRLKREVAPDLPDRIEERQDCELTDGQRLLYVAELKQARNMVTEFDEKNTLGQKKIHVLAALTRLREICCHPALVGGRDDIGSGKTSALIDLLEPLIAEGHKVLVFSQFVRMLKILEGELTTRSIPYHLLTGQTTKREQVVQAFQEDPRASVFLLSLKAAGTGLNLTAASYVVLYDPWWNPAVEAQAIDRTHRIGQDRTVITYRLVAKNTVEDKIYQLQQQKASMVKDILGEEGFARSLNMTDLQYLFSEEPTPSQPAS